MSLISSKFADELCERDMRNAYLEEQTCTKIVEQIRVLRSQRGWSQAEFAKRLGKPPSNVSQRLENRDYRGFTVNTLLDVAHAYDVGLVIEFVPYVEFIRRTNDLSRGALEVPAFDRHSLDPICRETSPQAVTLPVPIANALPDVAHQWLARTFQSTSGLTASGPVEIGTDRAAIVETLFPATTRTFDYSRQDASVQSVQNRWEVLLQDANLGKGKSPIVQDLQALGIGAVA